MVKLMVNLPFSLCHYLMSKFKVLKIGCEVKTDKEGQDKQV